MLNLKPKICNIVSKQLYGYSSCTFSDFCSHTEDTGGNLCKFVTLITQETKAHIDDMEVSHLRGSNEHYIGHCAGIHDTKETMIDSL